MGASAEKVVRQKWCLLQATMDERARRLWSGTEAGAIGWVMGTTLPEPGHA